MPAYCTYIAKISSRKYLHNLVSDKNTELKDVLEAAKENAPRITTCSARHTEVRAVLGCTLMVNAAATNHCNDTAHMFSAASAQSLLPAAVIAKI